MPRAMISSVSEQVLDQAMRLFWERGYFDTSVDDLVAGTGLSRAAIYSAFGSKEQLFVALLERFRRLHTDLMLTPLQGKDAALPELRAFFLRIRGALARRGSRLGCLLCATAADPSAHMPSVAPIIRTFLADLRSLMSGALLRAQQSGQLRYGGDVEPIASCLAANVVGLMTLARSPAPRSSVTRAVDGVLHYLDTLAGCSEASSPPAPSGAAG